MSGKTHHTAVVVIPPEACWTPIQEIRRHHDRHVRRWMPHITLVHPFRARGDFDEVGRGLAEACKDLAPFSLRLRALHHFGHGRDRYTLWLAPEPAEPLIQLQAALVSVVPDCDDTSRYPHGFTPHLSVGQVRGREALDRLVATLQADWRELAFDVAEVSLIWRGDPPDDVFRVDRVVPLGA